MLLDLLWMVSYKSPRVIMVRGSSSRGPLCSTRKVLFHSTKGGISSATSTSAGLPTSSRVLFKVNPRPSPPIKIRG